jgi:hypothetical protein
MDFYNELEKLCKTVEGEIEEANEKIRKTGGKVSSGDLEYIDKLTHTLKSIKTTMAMMDAESEYDGMANYEPHYQAGARGRGRSARRDSMGRYSREDRSYQSYDNGMINELRSMMEDAPNERMKQEFRSFISKMEQM